MSAADYVRAPVSVVRRSTSGLRGPSRAGAGAGAGAVAVAESVARAAPRFQNWGIPGIRSPVRIIADQKVRNSGPFDPSSLVSASTRPVCPVWDRASGPHRLRRRPRASPRGSRNGTSVRAGRKLVATDPFPSGRHGLSVNGKAAICGYVPSASLLGALRRGCGARSRRGARPGALNRRPPDRAAPSPAARMIVTTARDDHPGQPLVQSQSGAPGPASRLGYAPLGVPASTWAAEIVPTTCSVPVRSDLTSW